MKYESHPELRNHVWLHAQLQAETIAQFSRRTGIPFNVVNNQVKQMPEALRDSINRGRFIWTEEEKRAILEEALLIGHSTVSLKYDIAQPMLTRWRRELGYMNTNPLRYGRKIGSVSKHKKRTRKRAS